MSIHSLTKCESKKSASVEKAGVLVINADNNLPDNLRQAMDRMELTWEVRSSQQPGDALPELKNFSAAAVILSGEDELNTEPLKTFIEQLHNYSVAILILAEPPIQNVKIDSLQDKPVCLSQDESADTIMGRLAALIAVRPTIQRLNGEINRLNTITQPVNSFITQLDEEMRLAARLQRDFLPQQMPQIPGLRFATIYRPATWVSGDIYDVMRLDEQHIGFYVADAVGHGMPAALLTMFIKRALVTKIIMGNSYQLIEPGVALGQLGGDMVSQDLSNFQFATCCYAILNVKTLRLRVANAGHPPPMLIDENAHTSELDVKGPLLGVFPDQKYQTQEFQLHPRQKLLMYSDGVELAFVNEGPDQPLRFRREFGDLAHCDVETMCNRLLTVINQEEGSLNPRDDVTIVGMEILDANRG
jgi:phosphoserine phosphatase RsbU/P